ncbi:hypothetical protein H5P28_11075 [Ruficoccus amylovorans]|uniref:PD(D/E)XK endonuclease domain-containing protein n=1 Tax=Ruficoccus amylovorans TaxID=1804625 RepID=A0A842HEE5_9BACT|nr:hypothetical protein [Ruficoccus amylovorans]MBC2594802.1 hypothetical protein [Ruficoccus amylovorans]
MNAHTHLSGFREKLIEHLFIGELLKCSWKEQTGAVEVSKPEVDRRGYDLIVESGTIIRHVQLKTTYKGGKAAVQKVHIALAEKPSGCVVWIYFDEETLELGPFLFFGGPAGCPLPTLQGMKIAKHTKGNKDGLKAERPEIREVPKRQFKRYDSIREVYDCLIRNENPPSRHQVRD